MRRREFLSVFGGAAATLPLSARAQGQRRIPRIGVLWHAASAEEEHPYFESLIEGFKNIGYGHVWHQRLRRIRVHDTRAAPRLRSGLHGLAAELAIVPHYRARPLDGVWATAPCLHNGSVPTLQDMLTPQDERPKKFCVEAPQPRILADDW
jgi:hypothetical protein